MLLSARRKRSDLGSRNEHATHSDFCAVFLQHLGRLYLLALMLTGDELNAEKCFFAAFDSCVEQSRVFRESAVRWSRRSVIKSAIGLTLPAPDGPSRPHRVRNRNAPNRDQDASLKCVQDLPPFDRFVFVMSVLEGYSDRECALLLACTRADIVAARIRAFQQISAGAERAIPA
jgi:hypothetical protein